MDKLADINYALIAQLSYLHWNKIDNKRKIENKVIRDIFLDDKILTQIKTDFYDEPKNFPSNETIGGKQGTLPEYTYHEEDKRLFLVYSTIKSFDNTKALFGKTLDGWEYLDCATGEIIQNNLFPLELLKEYKESGFFGVAFQRGNDIMIAYRGTEDKVKHSNKPIPEDIVTDINIYFKETDIQQVEAVLFYEYIKSKYGAGKKIHITGHSLAGALAQYVYFYAYYQGDSVFTVTWNGLGAYGSILHSSQFFLNEIYQTPFKKKINGIEKDNIKERLENFYGTSLNILENKREELKDSGSIINYFMDEDFVGGWFNGDWIGKKVLVNVKEKTLLDRAIIFEENQKPDYTKAYGGGKVTSEYNIKEKKDTALKFHNVNNFLVFMEDSGNIIPNVIRPEFRKNALKSIVKDKIKAYSSLKIKGKEYELCKGADEEINIYSDILTPTNRLIRSVGKIVSSTAVRQKDILFVESFEQNDFKSSDMEVKEVSGEEYIKEIKLGEYNNLERLGGIVGGEELIIKVYREKKKEVEEKKIAQLNQRIDNFIRTKFERV